MILYDTGWKQQDYLKMTNSVNWAPLPDLLSRLGIQAGDVTKIVIGHGHWDHAGTLAAFPNAVLYVQKAELDGIQSRDRGQNQDRAGEHDRQVDQAGP